ncbi:MAG: hypothetical protein IJD39_09060 [Clostridia bacterium]|nr:hypothetical protein [Clostridia bacterium]
MADGARFNEILKTILNGDLSKEEMERRLQETIDDELSGPLDEPADMELVEQCQSLLWALKTNGSIPYPDHAKENKQQLMQRLASSPAPKGRPLLRRAIAVAAILVLVLGLSVISIQWISGKSTPDGQQYIVQGHEISTDLIQKCIAENMAQGSLITASREEAEAFLGFDISVPDTLLGKYSCVTFDINILPIWIQCRMDFTFNEQIIGVATYYFTDMENSIFNTEQDAEGEYIIIDNLKVYMSANIGNRVLTWSENNTVYDVSGTFTLDQGISIIREIRRK